MEEPPAAVRDCCAGGDSGHTHNRRQLVTYATLERPKHEASCQNAGGSERPDATETVVTETSEEWSHRAEQHA